jgi:methyl-accepting chemotaxis protein
VNSAIVQVDQVTQKNAAMVEETTGAASDLRAKSAQLTDLVSQFKLVDSSDHSGVNIRGNIAA